MRDKQQRAVMQLLRMPTATKPHKEEEEEEGDVAVNCLRAEPVDEERGQGGQV